MKAEEIHSELELARTRGPLSDITIAPCPEALVALRKEIQKSDPDPAAISRIAASDVAMAASLIRIANSPFYARSRAATNVGDAVAMLGMGQSVNILTGLVIRKAIPVQSTLLDHFWETSTRRALAMGYMARQLYGVDADLAHTCGLFCHVGIPVLMRALKGYDRTIEAALARQDRAFIESENTAHRTDHAVVGAIVAKTWHLPPVIALAVRLHHDFTCLKEAAIPSEARALVAMTLVADHLVAKHEGVDVQTEWVSHSKAALSHLQITEVEVDSWVDTLHPMFEEVGAG